MIIYSFLNLADQAGPLLAQAPLTWSVPPLTLAVLLTLLRPAWRPLPTLSQGLLLSAGVGSVAGLFGQLPGWAMLALATLALGALLLDELLVQLPTIVALSSTLRRKR